MPNFVSITSEKQQTLKKNLFSVVGVYGGTWMMFHLMTVFFLGFIVGSPLLVGLFLGIASLWSMCIDIPLGTIQKYFSSKTLILSAFAFMLLASLIFLYFIYTDNELSYRPGESMWDSMKIFLSSSTNIIFLLLVSILYGTAKETYEVSALGYLLNLIDPSEYAESLSKQNISYGIGAVVGVLLSIIILSLKTQATQLVVFFVIFFIICAIIFVTMFFDNPEHRIDMREIKNLRITKPDINLKEAKGYVKERISTADFEQIKGRASYILMKPRELHRNMDYKEMKQNTKEAFGSLTQLVVTPNTRNPALLWLVGGIFIFGFWDTVVITFFITYIDELLKTSGADAYISSGFFVLGLLAIPAYALQIPFIKQAKTVGHYPMITFGLCISAVALFGLAIFGGPTTLGLMFAIIFGMINSAGYAAGFPLSQSVFAEKYNIIYANMKQAKSIDSDVSAGPLKILNNFANAVGLICAGALISWFGYRGMFFVFGMLVLFWSVISIRNKISWKLEEK